MNKFTFKPFDANITFKGNIFDAGNDFSRGYGKASLFLSKIIEFCKNNNISVGMCFEVNEITYFPDDAKNMANAFADLVDHKTTVYGYNDGNGTNDIIIINTFDNTFDGLDKVGFRVYNMPLGVSMCVHMNTFTDELLSKHFSEIFHSFNGGIYTMNTMKVEVDINEEE